MLQHKLQTIIALENLQDICVITYNIILKSQNYYYISPKYVKCSETNRAENCLMLKKKKNRSKIYINCDTTIITVLRLNERDAKLTKVFEKM